MKWFVVLLILGIGCYQWSKHSEAKREKQKLVREAIVKRFRDEGRAAADQGRIPSLKLLRDKANEEIEACKQAGVDFESPWHNLKITSGTNLPLSSWRTGYGESLDGHGRRASVKLSNGKTGRINSINDSIIIIQPGGTVETTSNTFTIALDDGKFEDAQWWEGEPSQKHPSIVSIEPKK